MKTFYDMFFALPTSERKRIADESGMSLPYILKQVYVKLRNPRFHFSNAVRLDKASGGKLPFHRFTEEAEKIDWHYVGRRLRQAQRKDEIQPLPPTTTTKEVE